MSQQTTCSPLSPLTAATPFKENLHTHTTFCDGKDTAEALVVRAMEAGFDVLGFSGHSYTSFDESYCMSAEDVAKYRDTVHGLAQKYGDRITVLCGIEQDYYGDEQPLVPSVYDYVIGSVHAFFKPCRLAFAVADGAEVAAAASSLSAGLIPGMRDGTPGYYIYVDCSRADLEWAIDRLYGGDALRMAEDYYAAVCQIQGRTGCQIIGHFDLLTKFDEQGAPLFDQGHPRYQAAVQQALEALLPTGAIFEINTGAMSKGYRTTPYPASWILKKIRAGGGRITISSDCHAAPNLDFAFDYGAKLAQDCGFSSYWVIDREGQWVERPISAPPVK